MGDSDIGIGISIKINKIIINDKEIEKIKKEVNSKLEGKLKADISFDWNKKTLETTLSQIRERLKTNPLKIEIKTFLNSGELNAKLVGIQNKFKQIGLGLGDFKTSADSTKTKKDLDDIIRKYETITKMADGYTTKKLTQNVTKTGVEEKETTIIDERKKAQIEAEKATQEASKKTITSLKNEKSNVEELVKSYSNLKKVVLRKDASFNTKAKQETFVDPQTGIEATKYTAENKSTTYRIVDDINKRKKAEIKAQEEIRNAILQTEQTRRKEAEKTAQAQAKAENKAKEEEYKRQQSLGQQIGNYSQLKNAQVSEAELAKIISREYKNQEVRAIELDRVTGKYTATLKENASQNRVVKGTLDSSTGTLYRHSEALRESTASTKGFVEQLKIALTRVNFCPLYW